MLCRISVVVMISFVMCVTYTTNAYADTTSALHVGLFVDTYYMYDVHDPDNPINPGTGPGVRQYSFSSNRHNSLAVNLALVDVTYTLPNVRTRLALQAGTYVDANYSSESQGLRFLHAATVGVKLANRFWIDAGIMPSHLGLESAISSDNINYTRSLMAEYSPYYETGVKLTWETNDEATFALLLLNGWQNIEDQNSSKAIGTQITYKPSSKWLLNWSTFLGNERPDYETPVYRIFNNLYATFTTSDVTLAALLDCGVANTPDVVSVWWATALQVKVPLSDVISVNGRIESYVDYKCEIVESISNRSLGLVGGSIGVDVAPHPYATFRFEARAFQSVFATAFVSSTGTSKRDAFVTAALVIRIP